MSASIRSHRPVAALLSCLLGAWMPAAVAAPPVGPCGGVTPTDAATILKVPLSDVIGPKSYKTFSCVYRSKRHPYRQVTFNIYVADSPAQAAQALASLKEGLGFLSPIKAVPKLGDEAYRAPDPRVRRMLMRKGRVWVDVLAPGDAASQLRIVQIVLEHLQ